MSIPVMSLLPQFSAAAPTSDGTAKAAGGQGFQGILALLATATTTTAAKQTSDSQTAPTAKPAAVKQLLQDLLQSLTSGKLDMTAPGLGLTAQQTDQLLANLQKLLHDTKYDGAELLASLLAASQAASSGPGISPADVAGLTKLLGTSADGSVSTSALGSNLDLLAQAIQLVSSSGGKQTLTDAVQQLTPKDDAFAQQLAELIQTQDEASTDAGPPDTGPPKVDGSGQVPRDGQASGQASATAGSDGHELTVSVTLTSPTDGAAQEANNQTAGTPPNVQVLADVIEALLKAQQAADKSTQASSATATADSTVAVAISAETEASAVTAGGPALPVATAQELLAAQLAQMFGPSARTAASAPAHPTTASGEPHVSTVSPGPLKAGPDAAKPADQPQSIDRQLASAAVQTAVSSGTSTASGQADQTAATGSQPHAGGASSDNPLSAILAAAGTAEAAPVVDPQAAPNAGLPQRVAVEQAVLDQIVQNASIALRNGEQEFRIQLKPDFLGAMEVRVSVTDGTALVRMTAENAATRQLIDANLSQLRQAFGTGSIRVEHVPSFSSSNATWSFNQNGQQQGFWQGQNPYDGSNCLPEAIPFTGDPEPGLVAASATQDSGLRTQDLAPTGAIDLQA